MIKYFSVKNFYSFRDEVSFELDINRKAKETNHALILYGSNASGKTNLLKAISFLLFFIRISFQQIEKNSLMPFEAFLQTKDENTTFYVEFLINEKIYIYELELNRKEVIREILKTKRGKVIVHREKLKVIKAIRGERELEKNLRNNISILSLASSYNTQKEINEVFNLFYSSPNLGYKNQFKLSKEELVKNAKDIIELNFKDKVLELLKIADTEIIDFKLIPENEPEEIFFYHKSENGEIKIEADFESDGTIKLFNFSLHLIGLLKYGGILILDEIDSKLHFKIVKYVIDMFKNSEKAQLICSSHNPCIINNFSKETLWFVEKENSVSKLYCANDFEELKKDKSLNLETLYKIGRFGAVPKSFYPNEEN